VNLLRKDLYIRARAVLLLAFIAIILLLMFLGGRQKKQLREVNEIKELIAKMHASKQALGSRIGKANFVLNGIILGRGGNLALIEGNFYRKGDLIDGFIFNEIGPGYVILQDKYAGESRTIFLEG